MMSSFCQRWFCLALMAVCLAAPGVASAAWEGELKWNAREGRVSADIRSGDLVGLLERVAGLAGWQVFVESNTTRSVSVKFTDLPTGAALQRLLGDVSYALVPATNSAPRLYVFRTSQQNATERIQPLKVAEAGESSQAIPNELIVRLKPGAKIEDLAKALGAKVVGRIDSLNAYRLQFEDGAATDQARQQLANNSDVASVDSNFAVDRPAAPAPFSANVPPPQLQLKPPPDSGRIIVGLIDTAVQPLGNNLDQFVLKQISVTGDFKLTSETPSHGTAMAETLLRSLQEITKGSTAVQILPVNIYPGGGLGEASTTTFDVANGIVQAANGGAKIINLSLGSRNSSDFLHNIIQDINKLGIPIFAAAGNEPVTTPFYPAAYSEVKAVTAVDRGQLAPYASRGSFVSLGAPGSSVVPFGNQSFGIQGTSVSSAYTAGIAAGYLETSGASVSQLMTFLNQNFGVKLAPGK
jgi:hypothetical protein